MPRLKRPLKEEKRRLSIDAFQQYRTAAGRQENFQSNGHLKPMVCRSTKLSNSALLLRNGEGSD